MSLFLKDLWSTEFLFMTQILKKESLLLRSKRGHGYKWKIFKFLKLISTLFLIISCGWVVVATWGITVSKLESLASRNIWSALSLSNGEEAAEAADTENRGSCYINCSQGVPFLALVTVPFRAVANGVWSYGSLEKYRDFFFLFVVSTFLRN